MPEGDTRVFDATSASAISRSVSAVSSGHVTGERILRDHEAYMAGLRAGVAGSMEASYRHPSGVGDPCEREAYRTGVQVGMVGAAEAMAVSVRAMSGLPISPVSDLSMVHPQEEERVCELPPDVVERLSFREALSAANRRSGNKRRREDKRADDPGEVVGGSGSAPPHDDDTGEGGDEGASGSGCPTT